MGLLIVQPPPSADGSQSPPPNTTTDQAPTVREVIAEFVQSDVGSLGFLFGHDLGRSVPTPLEYSPPPDVSPRQLADMGAAIQIAGDNTPTPADQSAPAKWTFAQTLRLETEKLRQRVANARGGSTNASQ